MLQAVILAKAGIQGCCRERNAPLCQVFWIPVKAGMTVGVALAGRRFLENQSAIAPAAKGQFDTLQPLAYHVIEAVLDGELAVP